MKNQQLPTSRQILRSRRSVLALLAGVPGLLAACGRGNDPAPTPTAAAQATRTPRAANSAADAVADAAAHTAANRPAAPIHASTPTPTGPILPDRLVIPRIELDIPVVELGWSTNRTISDAIFSEWDVAAHAAGWHKNSALPGQGGNVVMSGHNNILGAVFRQLDQLRRDDEITVYSGAEIHTYQVERVLIVPETNASAEQRRENAQWIEPTEETRLTLVSCWPRNDNTHRIIVVAHPSSPARRRPPADSRLAEPNQP